MQSTIGVGVVYGSARPGRFCDTVATWAAEHVWATPGFALDLIDPACSLDPANANGLEPLRRQVERADAFVIVVPEHDGRYPPVLKTVIDAADPGWAAKPVAFVSYGGESGGRRAVAQLRLELAERHAVTVRQTVGFPHPRRQFDADGRLIETEPFRGAMVTMLAQLKWWAAALREARRAVPYARRAA